MSEILKEYNLSLRKDKREFGFKPIDFLGYTIDANGVRASSENVQKVQEFPIPASRKEVQRFLGIAKYNRRFVKDFAKIAAPLSALTSPKIPFVFGEKEESAFNAIEKCIYEAPLLTLPDYEKTFQIRTDASEIVVGAMVFQLQEDEEYPIAYHSKTLQGSEKNWGATDRELFAIGSANRKWTHFCTGKVVFHTDHEPLKHIRNLKDSQGKIFFFFFFFFFSSFFFLLLSFFFFPFFFFFAFFSFFFLFFLFFFKCRERIALGTVHVLSLTLYNLFATNSYVY